MKDEYFYLKNVNNQFDICNTQCKLKVFQIWVALYLMNLLTVARH